MSGRRSTRHRRLAARSSGVGAGLRALDGAARAMAVAADDPYAAPAGYEVLHPAHEREDGHPVYRLLAPPVVDTLADVERAAELDRLGRELVTRTVLAARAAGESWAAIGAALGVSRQAALKKYGVPVEGSA